MRIRKYMVIGVFSIIVLPWIVYGLISIIDGHTRGRQNVLEQAKLTQTIQMIAKNESNWTDQTWQHKLDSQLEHQHLNVEIRSSANQVIFQSAKRVHPQHWSTTEQVAVTNDGKLIGTIFLTSPGNADPTAAIGAIGAAILAVVLVSWQVGRNVIKPLESMSRAALQVAEGDLDLQLISSNTREIRQVRTAFQVMVQGLRDAFARQQKLEDERRFFIGAIAHDLRTPLFALRGYLDGITQGVAASPEKVSQYLAVCQDKAAHLERLVSDLFAFTRLEYVEQTLQTQPCNLSNVLKSTVSSMAYTAQNKEIVLDATISPGDLYISGDPHLLERAVTNLLDNAIRHTPNQGKITIELQTDPDKIVLKLRDTGPGFMPEDLIHGFEPMYRGDKSRNVSTGGAGLGLPIARRIFCSHGGDLIAENGPNGGAVLIGWLPRESKSG